MRRCGSEHTVCRAVGDFEDRFRRGNSAHVKQGRFGDAHGLQRGKS